MLKPKLPPHARRLQAYPCCLHIPVHHSRPSHQALTLTPTPNLPNDEIRIPANACFPWDDGATDTVGTLKDDIDAITSGSVVVTKTGDMTATSAYGYTYDIDFEGDETRGDMDLRYGFPGVNYVGLSMCLLWYNACSSFPS